MRPPKWPPAPGLPGPANPCAQSRAASAALFDAVADRSCVLAAAGWEPVPLAVADRGALVWPLVVLSLGSMGYDLGCWALR
ncbi:hypothetical protein [Streptomyces sirii]|uniref:hypothetical protein n=1 Tax=Streptomyces sirii TaxID=3127701 RepID=UPI003D35EA8D